MGTPEYKSGAMSLHQPARHLVRVPTVLTEISVTCLNSARQILRYYKIGHDPLFSHSLQFTMRKIYRVVSRESGYGQGTTIRFPARGGILFLPPRPDRLSGPASQPASQPPIQWVARALSPVIKRPGCEAGNSPPSNAQFKNTWSRISTPLYVFTMLYLVKHWHNFTLSLRQCGP